MGIHTADANLWHYEQDIVKKERHRSISQTFKTEPKIEDSSYDNIEPVTSTSDTVWDDKQDVKKERYISETFKTEPKIEDSYEDVGPVLLKQETADKTTVSEDHSDSDNKEKLFPLDVSSQATRLPDDTQATSTPTDMLMALKENNFGL